MFGRYSNQRISEAESKILWKNPDDYNWYTVYVRTVFKDSRLFEVRQDLDLPQSDDDNGVVLMFEGGDPVYFKTLDGDVTEEEVASIIEVCSHLESTFNRPISAYVVCPPDAQIKVERIEGEGDVTIFFSLMPEAEGEKTVERLEAKLKSGEEFTVSDSIDHMLLSYMGFKDKKTFHEKLKRYMALIEEQGRR